MITKEIAATARTFYHVRLRNHDGSALRCRANGRLKLWKTRPDDWRLPVKYGLKGCFYLEPRNAHEWLVIDPTEEARQAERKAKQTVRLAKLANLQPDAPMGIIADRLEDMNLINLAQTARELMTP